MNKIEFINNEVKVIQDDLDINVLEKLNDFDILKIKIKCKTKTKLEIINNEYDNLKIDIVLDIEDDLNILEINNIKQSKVRYTYNVSPNVNLNIKKFCNGNNLREQNIINLGEGSNVDFDFKTIALKTQKIEIVTNHKGKNSNSLINTKGISMDSGKINFIVTGVVPKGIKNCVVNQYNRVISLNNAKNVVNPILLIDEFEVEANHSAYLGAFTKDELFYIQSRGISYNKAINLLVNGFLREDDERIIKIIEKYWR